MPLLSIPKAAKKMNVGVTTLRLAVANGYIFWHVLAFTTDKLASIIRQTLNIPCLDGVYCCGG